MPSSGDSPPSPSSPSLLCSPFRCFSRRPAGRGGSESAPPPGGGGGAPLGKKRGAHHHSEHVTFNVPPNVAPFNGHHDSSSFAYHQAREGTDGEWAHGCSDAVAVLEGSDDGSVYMDAVDDLRDLTDEDFALVAAYPPAVTVSSPSPRRVLDLDRPETLLRPEGEDDGFDERAAERAARAVEGQSRDMLRAGGGVRGMRRSTRRLRRELTRPDVEVEERGFPGRLTNEEVEAVQVFRRELESRDPVYSEIVRGFSAVEDEPYALCRYLRARKFDPDKVFELLDEGKDLWREASKFDFYPDVEAAVGAPRSLFTSQYPFVYGGRARNGCPVAYLMCGGLQSEGVLCVTTMEKVPRYFWNSFMYDFVERLGECGEADGNFVRCECMQVYDLKGLSRQQVNSDALDVIKMANQITTCFPETLHCLVIVNAPGFFSFAWKLIKRFVDPRTASKIEVYSGERQARRRLLELIDAEQLASDYGGTAPSHAELIQEQCVRGGVRGNVVELMHLRGGHDAAFQFEVPEGERMDAKVYTRSRAGGHFSLYRGSNVVAEVDVGPPPASSSGDDDDAADAKGGGGGGGKDPHVEPYRTRVSSDLAGPDRFRIVGRLPAKSSHHGYFLFVGDRFEVER